MIDDTEKQTDLILAAEDCPPELFDELHSFTSQADSRVLRTLIAHGPVLLRGGRGMGKSAFMVAASRQLDPHNASASAVGIFMTLRHLKFLRATGIEYEKLLCEHIITTTRDVLGTRARDFDPDSDASSVQRALSQLANSLGKRIVLFFDDAAHLGREAALVEFFDTFRTLSSHAVSCKATIYPGVTRSGKRFDIYNDATVVDLLRSEEVPFFDETFLDVMNARYPRSFGRELFHAGLSKQEVASFLAQATLGNMRGFVKACNALQEICPGGVSIGLEKLGETLIQLASNHYWPLLDEVQPKLGKYEPMVDVARGAAELIFKECASKATNPRDILIHREVDERLAKPLQILEYAGFISKRQASRAMKSGGRGARYALNLCTLLELTPKARLTKDIFDRWTSASREEAVQFNIGSKLNQIEVPNPEQWDQTDLEILSKPVETLEKSAAYPYGLTPKKIGVLKGASIKTVGALAEADDDELLALDGIGPAMLRRIHNVLGQAIWM